MSVAHDAASESHTGTTGSASESSFTWNHGGRAEASGGVQGVLVFTHNRTSGSNDNASAVTYGGIAMSAVSSGRAVDTATEPGETKTWFLGTGLLGFGGTQAIVVTRTNNADIMYASAVTVTAEGDTTTGTPVLIQGDGTLAESSVDDGSPGSNSVRYAAIFSGLGTPPAAGASSTALTSIDFTALGCAMVRETTAGQGSRSVGFSSGTTDDRAAVAVAVKIASVTLRTVSDTLKLGLRDDDITSFELATFDALQEGLTETATTSISGLLTPTSSDGLALGLSENAAILKTETASDTLVVGLEESVVIAKTESVSDALGLGLSEAAASSTAIATSDTVVFGLDDPDLTAFEYELFDLLKADLTELATVVDVSSSITSIVGSELLALGLTETPLIDSVGVAADALTAGLTENAVVLVTSSASDALPVGLTESASPVVALATADDLTTGLTESATERVNENVSDALTIRLVENSNINTGDLVTISTSDSLTFGIDDADITSFELVLLDSLPLGLTEGVTAGEAPTEVVPITASDSIAFVIDEPYLADTQVGAAESVSMGLTETASVVDLTGGLTTLSASESMKMGLTESAVVHVDLSASDSLALVIDEPYTDETQVIASDEPMMGLVETATIVDLTAGLVTQSTLEVLPFNLDEAVSLKANLSYADVLPMGLTEFATVEVGEQVQRTTPDSLVLGLAEEAEIDVAQPASELLPLVLTEQAAIAATLDTTGELLSMGLQESANIVDLTGGPAFITAAESLPMGLTEQTTNALSSSQEELLSVGLTETATIAVVIVVTDELSLGLTDSVSALQVNVTSSDELPAGLAEAILQTVIASAQDGVGFVLDDTVAQVQAFLSESDAIVLGLTDLSELIDVGGIATKSASDALTMGLSENGVVHAVSIAGPTVLVATVEYLGEKTVEPLGLPKEAELWTAQ